jgi:hypothetical protein
MEKTQKETEIIQDNLENEEVIKKVDKKFNLESDKNVNLLSFSKMCHNHKEIHSEYKCPVCKRSFCSECFKSFKKKENLSKGLCKSCYKNYIIKVILFYFFFFFLLNAFLGAKFYFSIFGYMHQGWKDFLKLVGI